MTPQMSVDYTRGSIDVCMRAMLGESPPIPSVPSLILRLCIILRKIVLRTEKYLLEGTHFPAEVLLRVPIPVGTPSHSRVIPREG